ELVPPDRVAEEAGSGRASTDDANAVRWAAARALFERRGTEIDADRHLRAPDHLLRAWLKLRPVDAEEAAELATSPVVGAAVREDALAEALKAADQGAASVGALRILGRAARAAELGLISFEREPSAPVAQAAAE